MTVLDAKSEAVKALPSKKTIGDLAKEQGKHPIDVFLDLAVADNLDLVFDIQALNYEPEGIKAAHHRSALHDRSLGWRRACRYAL